MTLMLLQSLSSKAINIKNSLKDCVNDNFGKEKDYFSASFLVYFLLVLVAFTFTGHVIRNKRFLGLAVILFSLSISVNNNYDWHIRLFFLMKKYIVLFPGLFNQLLRFSFVEKNKTYKEIVSYNIYLMFQLNIFIACLFELQNGMFVNALLGFALNILTPVPKKRNIFIETNGDINYRFGYTFMICYTIWNAIFVFNSVPLFFGEHVAILASPFLSFLISGDKNHWFMFRTITLGSCFFPFEHLRMSLILGIISLVIYTIF